MPVSGVREKSLFTCKSIEQATIKPRFKSNFSCEFDACVLSKITCYASCATTDIKSWKHLEGLSLADPDFDKPGPIDLLLGATVHAQIVKGKIVKGGSREPIAMQTVLGWIISGEI